MAEKRKVYMYDLYGKFIREFDSISEASKETKIGLKGISANCLKVNKSTGGMMFSYNKFDYMTPHKSTIEKAVNCCIEKCESKVFASKYCSKHYSQLRNHGRILSRSWSDPNEIVIKGNYAEVYLYDKRQDIMVEKFIIDLEDIGKVSRYVWGYFAGKDRPYVLTRPKGKSLYLHRYLMDCTDRKFVIDHINGNVLDNRRSNLRIVTQQGNMRNITRINPKNYYFNKANQNWQVNISINDRTVYVGAYLTEDEAKIMAKEAREKYYIIEEF